MANETINNQRIYRHPCGHCCASEEGRERNQAGHIRIIEEGKKKKKKKKTYVRTTTMISGFPFEKLMQKQKRKQKINNFADMPLRNY